MNTQPPACDAHRAEVWAWPRDERDDARRGGFRRIMSATKRSGYATKRGYDVAKVRCAGGTSASDAMSQSHTWRRHRRTDIAKKNRTDDKKMTREDASLQEFGRRQLHAGVRARCIGVLSYGHITPHRTALLSRAAPRHTVQCTKKRGQGAAKVLSRVDEGRGRRVDLALALALAR